MYEIYSENNFNEIMLIGKHESALTVLQTVALLKPIN